ncbi:MAG: hypothetical protein Q9170_000211 [Blastenia crenularia]
MPAFAVPYAAPAPVNSVPSAIVPNIPCSSSSLTSEYHLPKAVKPERHDTYHPKEMRKFGRDLRIGHDSPAVIDLLVVGKT